MWTCIPTILCIQERSGTSESLCTFPCPVNSWKQHGTVVETSAQVQVTAFVTQLKLCRPFFSDDSWTAEAHTMTPWVRLKYWNTPDSRISVPPTDQNNIDTSVKILKGEARGNLLSWYRWIGASTRKKPSLCLAVG